MAQAILSRVLDDIKTLEPGELLQVEEAIRARMPEQNSAFHPALTSEQIKAANALLRKTIVRLPHATGDDNDSIDADLAREYGEDHAGLYRPGTEE
jgi:hypothetical protein